MVGTVLMPGIYTGEFVVISAPTDGVHHKGDKTGENVRKGHSVYLHPGHTVRFVGGLVVGYPRNSREGRPFLTLETSA